MTREERLKQDGVVGKPVLFFGARNEHGAGSNYALCGMYLPNPFTGKNVWHPTGEHRYQAMKATCSDDYEYVRCASGPDPSKRRGREIPLREGWGERYGDLCYYVMLETVFAKVAQNPGVAKWLESTGGRHIYEDSPTDDIWGWRNRDDYRGRNLLGICLMEVRKYYFA